MTAEPKLDAKPPRWPWIVFALAALWSIVIRIPLILNADNHLDSDLAVDGITLLEATQGHFRWHYPGTPFMGIGPVLYSLPQAMIWGASPITLVSGGTVAYVLLILATFILAWRAFGHVVACWSLVPLTFASTGVVWLSGRVTGGHLTAAVWHAGAFALLVPCLELGRRRDWLWLGLCCGFGVTLDSMFGLTLAGLLPVGLIGSLSRLGWRRAGLGFLLFVAAFLVGLTPRMIGERVDPHNAYKGQFTFTLDRRLLTGHTEILGNQCLPRLISGHLLPSLDSEPSPVKANGMPYRLPRTNEVTALAIAEMAIASLAFAAACFAVCGAVFAGRGSTARLVAFGLVLSSVATLVGFVSNRNIFNSDNYRYLVDLLAAWAIGFGLTMGWLSKRGRKGLAFASVFTLVFAGLMTADLERWYTRFDWLENHVRPTRHVSKDPLLTWLDSHPEITWIQGGYWDVYRLIFLRGGLVRGAPFPVFPNRFPEWAPTRSDGQAVLGRHGIEGTYSFAQEADREGWKMVSSGRGYYILVRP